MIPVTKPFLPPKKEYYEFLDGIWERNWLTNNGPLVNELELKLKKALDLKHLLFVSNGTIALQIAIKALDLKGEIITTPFSYVATTSSIVWEGCTPVFVDIDRQTLNIDPSKIEKAITSKTSAILATHVYGNPCDIDTISEIATKYGLKVIYDAAHAFGVKYKGRSVFEYGDISTTSFHATKLFHTIEGGALITTDPDILKRMAFMRNFGHDGPEKFNGVGINGKNSEFHAAMGIVNLGYLEDILKKRKMLTDYYNLKLANFECKRQKSQEMSELNYAYYPLQLKDETTLLKLSTELNNKKIFSRRYFYPSLNELSYIQNPQELPVANEVSRTSICLPLYHSLSLEEIDFICRILLRFQNYSQ